MQIASDPREISPNKLIVRKDKMKFLWIDNDIVRLLFYCNIIWENILNSISLHYMMRLGEKYNISMPFDLAAIEIVFYKHREKAMAHEKTIEK